MFLDSQVDVGGAGKKILTIQLSYESSIVIQLTIPISGGPRRHEAENE